MNMQCITLVEMLERNVRRHPEKTAILYMDSKLSYRMLYNKTMALADTLACMGLKKGDRVGLMMQKTPDVIIAFLGVTAVGGVVFPIDCNQTLPHMQYLMNLTTPFALIVSEGFQDLLLQVCPALPEQKIIVVGERARPGYRSWDEVLAGGPAALPPVDRKADDMAYFNLTSGTTGVPKCAVTTHGNIYWNTRAAVESLGLIRDDVHLCMFPVFSHPHELLARPMYLGGTIVLIDKISPRHIAGTIVEHQVTCMMGIASIYETLIRLHETSPFEMPSLRLPESGGMHVNPTIARQFRERFDVSLIPVWGSTEAAGIAVATPPGSYRPGSMGKACPYYEIKVIDDFGKESKPHEIGEMAIKGPAVCGHYFRSPAETQKHMKDGWFFTGDMVKKDEYGYFYFIGRKTGMMKVAGLKVYPIEIEDVLAAHPKIDHVAVVKVLDGLHGEIPKAVIVPKTGKTIDKKEIRVFCEEKLSKYKVPRIIEFRTELPRTSGGKILYRELG